MDKKLVGLCIVHRNHNYGSILQSYATLMKLEQLGVAYEIIDYNHPRNVQFYVRALRRLANKDCMYSKIRSLKKTISKKLYSQYGKNEAIRGLKFDEFVSAHFKNFSKKIHDYSELREYAKKYSDVLVGSDQLWLPSGLDTNFYNLMFAADETNKVAYAASFGVSSIPDFQREKTKEFLNRIEHISLREEAGKKIVKELTGRDVSVILDPTMIVTREQWDNNIPDQQIVEGDYIFCYFLGNNPNQRKEVKKLSKQTGLKIVVLRHLDEYIPSDEAFGDVALYDIGPSEFVNLIRHAEFICTDSFHGSVFSIIFEKHFISFNRYGSDANSRNSRLDTLFNNIGLSRRFTKNLYLEMQEPIDYLSINEQIEFMRKRSDKFIHDALQLN